MPKQDGVYKVYNSLYQGKQKLSKRPFLATQAKTKKEALAQARTYNKNWNGLSANKKAGLHAKIHHTKFFARKR